MSCQSAKNCLGFPDNSADQTDQTDWVIALFGSIPMRTKEPQATSFPFTSHLFLVFHAVHRPVNSGAVCHWVETFYWCRCWLLQDYSQVSNLAVKCLILSGELYFSILANILDCYMLPSLQTLLCYHTELVSCDVNFFMAGFRSLTRHRTFCPVLLVLPVLQIPR